MWLQVAQSGVGFVDGGITMTDEKKRFTRTREQTAIARKLRRNVSKTEKKLWFHLRDGQMGASFRRQHSIARGFTDYCCISLKLIVEVDGPTHDPARDSVRDHRMNQRGFDVLRFSVHDIDENLDGVVDTIHQQVQLRLLAREVRPRAGAGCG
jgi:very-short-patch-repair endonuclease